MAGYDGHGAFGARDPLRSLIFSALERPVRDVYVDGRQVVGDGEVLTLDHRDAGRRLNDGQKKALAGVAEGLSVTLETGRVTRVPGLAGLFGAGDDWDMVAMVAIGYPDEESVSSRTPVEHFATWG